jgi:hypothetical protein
MKTYDLFRRKVLKYIIIEFGIDIIYKKIKIFSNESYRSLGRRSISDIFPISNVSKKGDPLSPRLVHYSVEYKLC